MNARPDFTHEKPCPVRIGPREAGPISGGFAGWVSLISWADWFSNVNVFLEVPAAWANVSIRLVCSTNGIDDVVTTTTVVASGMQLVNGGTTYRGIVLAARGRPGSAWKVEALNDSADTARDMGTVALELWGTESTPDAIGDRAAIAWPDRTAPPRVSMLKGWDAAAAMWRPVAVNASGELVTVAGGGAVSFDFLELGSVAGAVVLDGADATSWRMTLDGNVTFSWVNLQPGAPYTVEVIMGAAGHWDVTFPGVDFDIVGTEPMPYPGFATTYTCSAHTSTLAVPAMIAGANAALAGYEVNGIDTDTNFGIRAGFSVIADPLSQFGPCVLWLGPCTGVGPSQSGSWYFQSTAGSLDVELSFSSALVGPTIGQSFDWAFGCSWLIDVAAGKDFDVKSAGALRFGFSAAAAWLTHDTGGVTVSSPAGSMNIDAGVFMTIASAAGMSIAANGAGNDLTVSAGQHITVTATDNFTATGAAGVASVGGGTEVKLLVSAFAVFDATDVGAGVIDLVIGSNTGDAQMTAYGAGKNLLLGADTLAQLDANAGGQVALTIGATNRVLCDDDGVTVFGARVQWTDINSTPVAAAIDIWYYGDAGSDVVNLPAGVAVNDGKAIGLTNASGSAMTVNPNGADTILGAASYALADQQTAFFTWHDSTSSWVPTPGP